MADLTATETAHLAILDEEIRLLRQLALTLTAESDAITARDIEALRSNGQAKLGAVEALGSLEQQRRPLQESRSQHETEREREKLAELRRLTRQCNEQNSANEALLRAERRFVDSLLKLLRGGSQSPSDVYGADAAMTTPGIRRLPLASA